MAGLAPAIHDFLITSLKDVDTRNKRPGTTATANVKRDTIMRAEHEHLIEAVKQSVGLLRRHL